VVLHVHVVDPLGVTRHELFRATKQGLLSLTLPLAANDPPGRWQVTVRELLNNTATTVQFTLAPTRGRSLAGSAHRAVYFGNDLENVCRFARLHREVTIVPGAGQQYTQAVDRITRSLEPWGVKCRSVAVSDAAKSRTVTEEEAKTWVGLNYAPTG